MFIAFTVLGVLWTLMVIRGKADSHKIHYLMIVLVAFKSLTVLSQVREGEGRDWRPGAGLRNWGCGWGCGDAMWRAGHTPNIS
jgi:hypothetical protein